MELEQLRGMLKEWSGYVLSEHEAPTGLGFPSQSPGAENIGTPPKRFDFEDARHERLHEVAKRSGHYRTNHEGKREKIVDMVAQSNPKQSRSASPKSPRYEPWPPEIVVLDQAIQQLPSQERHAVECRYLWRMGRPTAARQVGVNQAQYLEVVARAEGALRAMVQAAA